MFLWGTIFKPTSNSISINRQKWLNLKLFGNQRKIWPWLWGPDANDEDISTSNNLVEVPSLNFLIKALIFKS